MYGQVTGAWSWMIVCVWKIGFVKFSHILSHAFLTGQIKGYIND